ncbi:MAG TPA: agmatinase [Bacteroidota bacterium]|nr:agmatinase [Candidatus Kapabacteria bacterium]HRS01262.1 agmatinase [Bacteroidota bacterium]HRT68428.1 agmatinase [Bacteroidota bacterium]
MYLDILPPTSNFLAIPENVSQLDNSKIVILPAPYEHTTSFGKGAANGPDAVLKASAYVEFYDDEFDKEVCFEQGISTIKPIEFENAYDELAIAKVYDIVKFLIEQNKFVVTIGGEHTISIAPIKVHFEAYPQMSILQFDAHSDLRDIYENSPYSHACAMARVADFFPNEHITQVGIRAQCIEEAYFIKEKHLNTFYASGIRNKKYGDDWIAKIVSTLNDHIYITFDLDVLDPSIIPSTGTPEPDGLTYQNIMDILWAIKRAGKQIIGFDVVELAPLPNLNYPDLTTARLIYKILNFIF